MLKNLEIRPVAKRVRRVQLHPLRVPLHPLVLRFALCELGIFVYLLHRYSFICCIFGYRSSPSLLPCLADFIVNDFEPPGMLAWLRARLYRGARAIDIILIFLSLDGTSSVRLKLCCTAAPRQLIFFSVDGTSSGRLKLCCTAAPMLWYSPPYIDGSSSVRLKLCCTAAPRLLMFSLDGTSSLRLKLCCTAAPRLLIFSSLDGTSSVRLNLCCTAAPMLLIFSSLDGSSSARPKFSVPRPVTRRVHWVQLHHQLHQQLDHHPVAPFGVSLCTICT